MTEGPKTPSSRNSCISYGQAVLTCARVVKLMYSWRGILFWKFLLHNDLPFTVYDLYLGAAPSCGKFYNWSVIHE